MRQRRRAVFLDRDGTINELVYNPEHGIVDSPSNPGEFELVKGIGPPLKKLKAMDFRLVVVSNQPGVAKRHFSLRTFREMSRKMERELSRLGITLDGEYYCFHHPLARVAKYRAKCDCRKPEPGLILRGAKDFKVSLRDSYVIGDGLVDVLAGEKAGCTTILVSSVNSLLVNQMNLMQAVPDFVARDLREAAGIISDIEKGLEERG